MSEKRTFGAASRSSPSLRWNSSRCSSGTSPTSRKRHHLPELHRRALHRPQRGDDLLGGLEVAALERLVAALLGAGEVGRAGAEVARPPGRPPGWRPSRCARAARSGSGPSPSAPRMAGPRAAAASGSVAAVGAARRRHGCAVAERRRGGAGLGVAVADGVGAGVASSPRRLGRPPGSACLGARPASGRRTGSCGGRWTTEPPNTASSEAVTTPAAMTNASAPVISAIFSRGRGCAPLAQAVGVVVAHGRRVVAQVPGERLEDPVRARPPSPRAPIRSGSRVGAADGLEAAHGGARAGAARHARRDRADGLDRLAQPLGDQRARSPGSSRSRQIVPRSQNIGTTVAATTAAAAETSRVSIERPPLLLRLVCHHPYASDPIPEAS